MTKFKKFSKRISAGIMAGICAVSMLATSAPAMIPVEAAEVSTENPAFPSADTLIAQAATLLGTPYGFGKKGYSGIYYQGSYKPLTEESIRGQGIDCSGLIYYSMTHLGYSTTGFAWNNPVPVDTDHWLSVKDGCTMPRVEQLSQICTGIEYDADDRFISLSTCTRAIGDDRTVLTGRLVEMGGDMDG